MELGDLLIASTYKTYEIKSRANRTPWTMFFGHNVRMEKPKERLKLARRAAGFDSPTEAAAAFPREINKNTIISHENGNREISRKAAMKYSELFGCDAGWLLYGGDNDNDRSDVDVPLLSMVSAGNLRQQPTVSEEDIIRHIKVGELPKGDWIALQCDGDSMDRIAPDGSILLVDRSDDRLLDGKFYIFAMGNGDATFKRYRRNPSRLQPFSTNPDHMSISAENDDLYVFGRVKRVIIDV